MHGPGRNVQRSIHVRLELKHKTFQAKHVKLFGALLSLRQRLPCFRGKLPSFAEIMSVRPRTLILYVRSSSIACSKLKGYENFLIDRRKLRGYSAATPLQNRVGRRCAHTQHRPEKLTAKMQRPLSAASRPNPEEIGGVNCGHYIICMRSTRI